MDKVKYSFTSEIKRELDVGALVEKNSFFLFGPRATGKSTLLKSWASSQKTAPLLIDLLRGDSYFRLSSNPSSLEELIQAKHKVVIIDEIQRVPELLNEVHRLIEDRGIRFILTGSSARRLKRTHANLLAGRAWNARFFPFVYPESTQAGPFDLKKSLRYGCLPRVFKSPDPLEELDGYVTTYLQEEIERERWVRDIPNFSRFLKTAALTSGELLNYANLSYDTGVSGVTIKEYYRILSDTLLGTHLEPFQESKKRKAIQTGKFYFFDTGVLNTLLETEALDANSDRYGKCLEHFILNELKAYLSYRRIKKPLTFWRSTRQDEVDFIVGHSLAIEVKASRRFNPRFLKGLKVFGEEGLVKKSILICEDPTEREIDSIAVMPVEKFLQRLWTGQLL
jgi:predicted AAA+ superfamily ATPase